MHIDTALIWSDKHLWQISPTQSRCFLHQLEPLARDSKHSNANSNRSKGIRFQIRTTRKWFEAVECRFEPLERDSKHSNPNSNHSKGIQSIRIQIRATWKGFEAEPFERDSKHLNANSNHSKGIRRIRIQIRTTWKGFEAFECKFEPFETD